MTNFIKKILVSEKSFQDAAVGKYTFIVDRRASKELVAKVLGDLFKVTVLSVNAMNYNGKVKTTKRVTGRRANFKKVILTLKTGDKIDLFEIENTEKNKEAKRLPEGKREKNKDLDKKPIIQRNLKSKTAVQNKTLEG